MDQENLMFFENDDKSYTMVDLYLNDRFLGYKDSYNCYDIDVDKILLFKKSDNEYIIRYNDDKEFYRKCIEIWNKIIELIGINNPIDFVEADDHDKLFITADVHKNTTFFIEDNYRYGHNKVVIVLHSVINDYLKTSLVQHKY